MEDLPAGEQDILKVDAAFFETRNPQDNRRSRIVLYNINIPVRYVQSQNEYHDVLVRVSELIQNDFLNQNIQFQITAAYWLKHNQTGELKKWCGSFSAQNNHPTRLTDFEQFNPASFIPFVIANSRNAAAKLRWNRQDTHFEFHQLISLILNFQTLVGLNHYAIPRRGLSSHARTTFGLP